MYTSAGWCVCGINVFFYAEESQRKHIKFYL